MGWFKELINAPLKIATLGLVDDPYQEIKGGIDSVTGSLTGKDAANAAREGAKTQAEAMQASIDENKRQFDIGQSNSQPYLDAGNQGLGWLKNGYTDQSLTRAFNQNDFTASPDYQYRLQHGMDGIQSQAAARGGLLSGATLKSLNEHNSNMAAQEYGQSYNRFNQDQQSRYSRLLGLAQIGQNTAVQQANNGANFANSNAQLSGAKADTQAQGLYAAAQAKQSGMNNILGLGKAAATLFL